MGREWGKVKAEGYIGTLELSILFSLRFLGTWILLARRGGEGDEELPLSILFSLRFLGTDHSQRGCPRRAQGQQEALNSLFIEISWDLTTPPRRWWPR